MQTIITRLVVALTFATISLASCSVPPLPEEEMQEPVPLPYEYLYGCLWTVTDLANASETLPSETTSREGAIFFQENSDVAYTLMRRPDLEESTGKEKVFSIVSQYSYAIDAENRRMRLSTEDTEWYFAVERLNDRTLTLYYRSDPAAYIAYSRCNLSSVTIAR